jgi:crotonobetaine/carnitine-CoA ligase
MFEHLRDPSRWTVSEVLSWQAQMRPTKVFAQTVDGSEMTFAEANEAASRIAAYLSDEGVRPGDPVVVFLPNGLDFLTVWLGLARLGAVAVLINVELTGAFLLHQLEDSGARVVVTAPSLFPAIQAIKERLQRIELVLMTDGGAGESQVETPWRLSALSRWRACARYDGPAPRASDIACIMYTSGTTGPAKGVLMPQARCFLFGLGAIDNLEITEADRYYVTLPLYHANGLFMQVYACLIAGAAAVIRERFSASNWLTDVRRYRTTLTNSLGVVAPFIFAQPETEFDRDHSLRLLVASPNPPELARIWRDRFGLANVVPGYGMTEVNIPAWGGPNIASPPGSAGRIFSRYFEVRIVDPETDATKPSGAVGEIVVRPRAPFGFMAGYHKLPDKTVEAWRNLWFHTGDAGYINDDGDLFFVDRIRDCIRRRGHNISSFEVERAFLSMNGVVEAAAYATPSDMPGGEDEIMVSVVPAANAELSVREICRHAERELPKFAQPRYIEIVPSLPKTPTGKVQKSELRKRGVASSTWDRET